jgi:predicted alpha/beta superfamily hydrolase
VSLPPGYRQQDSVQYPVVYILDANLYFDIFASIQQKYTEVGLLPPAILVGIGYKDFATMDSLRNRDYTYPEAIPEYEMSVSGGAASFLSFITQELIPDVESKYPADKNRRVLMGHSLGGYFTLYSLQQGLIHHPNPFYAYIAASPSLHYNNHYLIKEFEKLSRTPADTMKVYTSAGGLEEDTTATLRLPAALRGLKYKGEIYSSLDHMDTQLPTFVKGLQWALGSN